MYYVYVLQSEVDKSVYVGRTADLIRRLKYHNSGRVKSTKGKKPYKLVFYEAFKDKSDSVRDELFFKTGYGKEVLKDKLKNTLI
jgi:putative endonuclease